MRAMIGCLLGWVALACGSAGAPREILDTDKTTMRASLDSFTASAIEINGCGDLAYVRGTYQVAYLSGVTEHGKFLEIRRGERDGRWLIVADIFNSDVPTTTSSR